MTSRETRHSGAFRAVADARTRSHHLPPRVLVAEDDVEMRRLVAEALRSDGYEVREVTDGGRLLVSVTAQYQYANSELDLIISDVRMPICSGLQILKGLREAHWNIPFILMTAFGDPRTHAEAEELGAILFDKPFAVDDLRTAVMNLVPVE